MAEYCNGKTNSWAVVKQKRIPANNLNAMNTKERVYFIINNFPIDSGIRTTDRRLNSAERVGEFEKNRLQCSPWLYGNEEGEWWVINESSVAD